MRERGSRCRAALAARATSACLLHSWAVVAPCSSYREYAPCPQLRPYVECYWSKVVDPGAAVSPQRVLPDGCVDIIFDLTAEPRTFLCGTMTRLFVVPGGRQRFYAVRFRPGGAYPFLRGEASDWTDDWIELEHLWSEVAAWTDQLAVAPTSEARIERIEVELVAALPRLRSVDARITAVVDRLCRDGGVRIGALACEFSVSRQHLTRKVRAVCGLGPKRLARITRLRRLMRQTPAAGYADWAGAAVAAGYFDQAHLIHEFREVVGSTPARYFAG